MNRSYFRLLITSIAVLLIIGSCTPHWTKTIRYGKTIEDTFDETVKTDVCNGLHIVPVRIGGKNYRFLFDTGAMFSISEEIQQKMNYKTVSKGTLSDSDNNRRQVRYVQTDTLFIGKIPFTKQTAFVADFTKNPIIKCLEIDGIIGSNLMRHCQWTIDYQNAEIVLFNDTVLDSSKGGVSMPFKLNQQFDQIISLKLGKATLKNLKIDYGSNGSLTLSQNAMQVLKENEIIAKTFAEQGFKSSGLYGKTTASKREFAWADTIQMNDFTVEGVEIKTGKSGLIGGEILSRFVVTLDFNKKELHFSPVKNSAPDYSTFGFSLSYSDDKQFYIQAITENSPATNAGLRTGLVITKLNELDLVNGTSFCEYVDYILKDHKTINMNYIDETGNTKKVNLQRRFIY